MSRKFTATQTSLISIGRNSKGGTAHLVFILNGRLAKSLDWPDMPEGTGEWTPEVSSYQATTLELTPNADGLKKFAVEIETTKINGFQVQRKSEKQGKNARKAAKKKTEVSCTIHFNQEDGCAKLERFLQSGGPCSMTVTYVDAPVQDELPGAESEEPEE